MPLTPEQIADDVVASARLEGQEVPEDFKETLLQVARGERDADDVVKEVLSAVKASPG